MIEVTRITQEDDLESLVAAINGAQWDAANEISTYAVDALHAYLGRQDTLFMACHEIDGDAATFLGMASSRVEMKPYGHELWLYVDEVDVCADQRQKGAGTALMQAIRSHLFKTLGLERSRGTVRGYWKPAKD